MISGQRAEYHQPLFSRLWGAVSFLQNIRVSICSFGDPVLYLSDAPGIDRLTRRRFDAWCS
jgi:hypothetical protein